MTNHLPGMEEIKSLDDLAEEYKQLQKKLTVFVMAALAKEVELKETIMAEMKGQKKKTYKYEDIEIEIVTTQENLKVTIARDSDDESEG